MSSLYGWRYSYQGAGNRRTLTLALSLTLAAAI